MPKLTRRSAIWIAAAAACVVYVGALANQWALDDHPVIGTNPAAHSIPGAMKAAFQPYWPPSAGVEAGLYRPLTILSYAVDWTLSSGRPAWFHLVNLLLHGVATALLVLILLRWLDPWAACVAGLVFALHPVHVEATANVVGRAEILTAIGLFTAVLAARRYRASAGRRRIAWLIVTVATMLAAMLCKEGGVVALALIALDDWLETNRVPRVWDGLYVWGAAATIGWLFLWRAVAGSFVATTMAANFRGLSALERVWTMLPAQLHVLRLLTLPLELAPEYNPQLIPQATSLTATGVIGAVAALAIAVLGVVSVRRLPALAFGILAAVLSYAPTSNLVFASGVALAERALYVAAIAPAAAIGVTIARATPRYRRLAVIGAVLLLSVYAVRTLTRIPFWRDSRTVIVEDLLQHPDNFRAHARVASIYASVGDTARALAEYRAAEAIFPLDPFIAPLTVPLAIARRSFAFARADALRADSLEPRNAAIARLPIDVALAAGWPDSALMAAERAITRAPESPLLAGLYVTAVRGVHAPRWRELAALARMGALQARFIAVGSLLDSVATAIPSAAGDPALCDEVRRTMPFVTFVRPDLIPRFQRARNQAGQPCLLASATGAR